MFSKGRRPASQESLDRDFPEPQMSSLTTSRERPDGAVDANFDGHLQADDRVNGSRDQKLLAELDAAIKDGKVDLRHIVIARSVIPRDYASSDYTDRITAAQTHYYESWIVKDRVFCDYIPAAVALKTTKSGSMRLEIEFVYLPESAKRTDSGIEAAVWKARTYYLDASECRSRRRFDPIVRNIFFIIANLLNLADNEAVPGQRNPERVEEALSRIDDELKQVETAIGRALGVEARHQYLLGMSVGAVVLVGAVVFIRWILVPDWARTVHLDTLGLGTVIAGGVGAVLSVMTRLTANNLMVDATAGRGLVRLAGSFRPLIGGIFAFAIYAFVKGGLLPIKVTVTGLGEIYFFLSVAFLAGFSERIAQDAVTRAGSTISESGPLRAAQ